MSRRRVGNLAATLILAFCVACATGSTHSFVSSSSSGPLSNPSFLRAGSNVLVLTSQELYRQQGSGLAAVSEMPAKPYGQAAASTGFGQAAFGSDASNLVLAIATGFNSVSVFQSKNGGSNWTSIGKGTFSNAYDGLADVSVAAHGANIVILANPQSGSNSYLRSGDVMVTANSGSTWKSSRAPVGGTVTAGEGVFWLVGGPERDKVFE